MQQMFWHVWLELMLICDRVENMTESAKWEAIFVIMVNIYDGVMYQQIANGKMMDDPYASSVS